MGLVVQEQPDWDSTVYHCDVHGRWHWTQYGEHRQAAARSAVDFATWQDAQKHWRATVRAGFQIRADCDQYVKYDDAEGLRIVKLGAEF